jgi:hypothetical protein
VTRHALALCACVAALVSFAAPASASWGPAEDLISPGAMPGGPPESVMTSAGDVVATWGEDSGRKLGVWPLGAAGVRQDLAPGGITDATLATGGGASVAAYVRSDGDVHWRDRPAGGSFSAEQTLSPPSGMRALNAPVAAAMNVHGDLALVWSGGGVYAAVRPAGGTFSAPVALGGGSPSDLKAQLSDSGELLVAWTDGAGLHTARRSSGGQASQPQDLTTGGQWAIDALAMDAGGDAILVWRQLDGPDTTGRIATRAPGGDFSETAFPGAGTYKTVPIAATISGDGLVTLAYRPTSLGISVYSGQVGARLVRVHTFPTGYFDAALATSRGGRTVIAFDTDYYHRVSAQRTGSGAFGPIEDLRPDCGYVTTPLLGIDDNGHTSATWHEYPSTSYFLARGDGAPGHQGCAPAGSYSSDDAESPQGGPGGGRWGDLPHPPGPPLAALRLGRATMTGRGTTRTLKLPVECGEQCYANVSAGVVRPNGRVLQKWTAVTDVAYDGKLTVRITIVLPPKLVAKLATFGTDRPIAADLRLSVTDWWGRRVVRGVRVMGAPLRPTAKPASLSLTRCARARCRRRA